MVSERHSFLSIYSVTSFQICKHHENSVKYHINIYRSGTVNLKSFVGKVLLRIKRKFELINAL